MINHERGKDREVFATSGTYSWSCVAHIFHNGQQSHGGDRNTFEVMTSTAAGMLLHMNGKFTMGKLKSSLLVC